LLTSTAVALLSPNYSPVCRKQQSLFEDSVTRENSPFGRIFSAKYPPNDLVAIFFSKNRPKFT
jgi:hypothetical protein